MNPAGQIGSEPVPPGQEFTYTVRAQGRLVSEQEFADIVVRATPDGSVIRVRDVARVELGAQLYNVVGRLNGKPSAIVAVYQTPGSNALEAMRQATALMEELKQRFPADLDYAISLDTTLAVSEGINEILKTLFEAIVLVILVVFLFLQGWRATLIPLLAVPVSLVGTFVGRRLPPDRLHPRDHGPAVPAVRRHDRRLGDPFRFQCAHALAGPFGAAAAAATRDA